MCLGLKLPIVEPKYILYVRIGKARNLLNAPTPCQHSCKNYTVANYFWVQESWGLGFRALGVEHVYILESWGIESF